MLELNKKTTKQKKKTQLYTTTTKRHFTFCRLSVLLQEDACGAAQPSCLHTLFQLDVKDAPTCLHPGYINEKWRKLNVKSPVRYLHRPVCACVHMRACMRRGLYLAELADLPWSALIWQVYSASGGGEEALIALFALSLDLLYMLW